MSVFNIISIVIAAVALCGYVNARFVRLPDSIGITVIALLISLGVVAAGFANSSIAHWGARAVAQIDFHSLVFNGLLGLLLFAGSLHLDLSALARARWTILVLATLGVVLSTALVAGLFFLASRLFAAHPPLIDCLLFGALISPTDPIAVLGLLSKAHVPQSLLTKITGESLFNDGTGVVLFVVLTQIAVGTHTPELPAVAFLLLREVVGGLGFGLLAGFAGFWLLRSVDSYVVEILITLAMATSGYAAAQVLGVSAPIAAVVMGLVVGNHGRRYAMSERTRTHLFLFWELTDNLLNLVLFGLIGLELTALASPAREFVIPAMLAIPIVLLGRFVSVGIPVSILRRFEPLEANCVKLMTWAGLRGALSVAMALSLPYGHSRPLIVTATYLVAIFSILVQATTLGPLAHRWTHRAECNPQGVG